MKKELSVAFKHALMTGGYGDPFSVLGIHPCDEGGHFIRVCYPNAASVEVLSEDETRVIGKMERIHPFGLFQLNLPDVLEVFAYKLHVFFDDGHHYITHDPYRVGSECITRECCR